MVYRGQGTDATRCVYVCVRVCWTLSPLGKYIKMNYSALIALPRTPGAGRQGHQGTRGNVVEGNLS